MRHDRPVQIQERLASPSELATIPWLALLRPEERARAVDELRVGDAQPGDYVCQYGIHRDRKSVV